MVDIALPYCKTNYITKLQQLQKNNKILPISLNKMNKKPWMKTKIIEKEKAMDEMKEMTKKNSFGPSFL